MGINESLSNTLNIDHVSANVSSKEIINVEEKDLTKIPKEETAIPTEGLGNDAAEDYQLSRNVLRNLIQKGNAAIEDVHRLADQQESARGYEVLSTLIKTVAETTKDLYDIQKKTKDLKGYDKKDKLDETNITVDRAVFVGTTAELLKQIKEKRSEG